MVTRTQGDAGKGDASTKKTLEVCAKKVGSMSGGHRSNIVKLNVGGETFATSSTTLLSCGETFFSSLLSGRHDSEQDENGAYFIDRSPKYFGPILHYLRTNSIDIPSDYKLSSMRMEAEFYGIQKIVDHIDFLETEKKNEDNLQREIPLLGYVGCYVDEMDRNAFMFGEDDKLTLVTGDQAYTQAMVIHNHPQVPQEWSGDQSHARSFAVFYEQHVKKGKYHMNSKGRGLLLTLPLLDGLGRPKRGVVGTVMASLSDDFTSLCVFNVPRTYVNFTYISKSSTFCIFRFKKFCSDS